MKKFCLLLYLFSTGPLGTWAQTEEEEPCYVPEFEDIEELKTTVCKSQGRTGTCWSFATASFIETELLRIKDEEYNLSEMYFVHYNYLIRGKRFVRFSGTTTFSEGSLAHDVMNVVREYGFLTQEAYPEQLHNRERLNHSELSTVAKAYVEAVASKSKDKLSPAWYEAYRGIIEAYLGPVPDSFEVEGEKYSPRGFASAIDPDAYVEITSYTHHPFYSEFVLETIDNWAHASYYNVRVDELVSIMENALTTGYSVVWDGDVGNKHFHHAQGYALYDTDCEGKEEHVSQEMRQAAFNSFEARDEHLMHIVGTSKDEEGNLYFVTKNSWGTGNPYEGKVHMSEQYCRFYTVSIMVHKDALPNDIREKLGV
jgi:bleomycin hydrolase